MTQLYAVGGHFSEGLQVQGNAEQSTSLGAHAETVKGAEDFT